jgi:hypothetical protein
MYVTGANMSMNYNLEVERLKKDWAENPRWQGIKRGYTAEDVVRLRGSVHIEHTLAKRGAEKLWKLINEEPFVNTLGALTGNQAMQQVKAGLKAIYLSGWQVAADANIAGEMYPDQSLYPVNSVPSVVRKINNTFMRADQIQWSEGKNDIDYFAPIVADAEAGFGGVLNAFELMKAMIEAGAAGVHFEDQLTSVKKCGHMGGKVLVSTREAVEKLIAARLKRQSLPPFEYRDLGSLATIGRHAAVADLGRLKLSGLLAWWIWLLIHLLNIVQYQNRVLVLIQWAWNYFTRNRSARLISESATDRDASTPPAANHP